MKLKRIKIKNYKILQDFNIDFLDSNENILDTIVIAGINGSGKTTLLEFIFNLIKSVKFLNDGSSVVLEDRIINKDNTNGLAYTSGVPNLNIIYLKVFDNQSKIIVSQIKNFIDMIKDNNEDLTIKEANQKAVDDINSIFDGLDLKVKFKGISKDIKREILFQNSIKDDIKLDELSTGEQQLFIRAMSLKMMDIKNSIVLIDEPEISLHPNWQNKILKVYQNILKDANNQLIVATHSPHIISSTPNEALRILVKNENIEVLKYNSYGSEIEEVLQDIMGTEYLRTPEIAMQIKNMWNFLNNKDLENYEKKYYKLTKILDLNDKELVLSRLKKARLLSQK